MDEGVKMVEAIRHLFEDIAADHISDPTPMLLADNAGGIAWANSEAITKKMRHVNIREVAVRNAIKHGELTLSHIPGELNPADLFTKEMKDKRHFLLLRAGLMSSRVLR